MPLSIKHLDELHLTDMPCLLQPSQASREVRSALRNYNDRDDIKRSLETRLRELGVNSDLETGKIIATGRSHIAWMESNPRAYRDRRAGRTHATRTATAADGGGATHFTGSNSNTSSTTRMTKAR